MNRQEEVLLCVKDCSPLPIGSVSLIKEKLNQGVI